MLSSKDAPCVELKVGLDPPYGLHIRFCHGQTHNKRRTLLNMRIIRRLQHGPRYAL